MNVDRFFEHHGITENPFGAEEARHDPVYERLLEQANRHHPDFAKIMGKSDRASTSVVFGEKGSGKTATRLLMGRLFAEHNRENPQRRTLVVAYDNLNPFLDRVMQRTRRRMPSLRRQRAGVEHLLENFRLEDHQDAILSLATTKLVDALLGVDAGEESMLLPEDMPQRIKRMPRQSRVDALALAAIYDAPRSGDVVARWHKLKTKLKLGGTWAVSMMRVMAMLFTILAMGVALVHYVSLFATSVADALPTGMVAAGGVFAAMAIVLWGVLASRQLRLWSLCRNIHRETPAIERGTTQLRRMLSSLSPADLVGQPWPVPNGDDANNARYMMTARLMDVLAALDYTGMVVMIDRVDEPTIISGQADRMRTLLWPMFDNKFLQQERVGIKLLLPIELRHLLHRESSEFFQEARLDKQNMIDRLVWSGATLYDLCTSRLKACRGTGGNASANDGEIYLTDLFEPNVSREMLIDALEQMHQPRDAFKFLYSVIQEHCRMLSEDEAKFQIAKVTLEMVRRNQSQRVQDLYRGLSPA